MENIDITTFRKNGLSWSGIARETGFSRKRIVRYARNQPNFQEPYEKVSDPDAVGQLIRPYLVRYPSCGELQLRGYLKNDGFIIPRHILRTAIEVEDPGGRERRAKRTKTVRGPYNAHGPGFLWHTDTYHKLGLVAGIVISGAIDGFTREVVALKAHTSNSASNVLNTLLPAFRHKGVPRLLRVDAGSENVAVGKFMFIVRGVDSLLVGKSVHNQRIERFWRDLRIIVTDKYIQFFHSLGPLRVQPEEIWVIQHLFLTRIQAELTSYQGAWNNHPMRMEHMRSPLQLNLAGTRSYYEPFVEDDANIQMALTPLRDDYEGRSTSRGTCPFDTDEGKNIFLGNIPPLTVDDLPETWAQRLQEAFEEARRLQEWEQEQ
jgi:transposase InsO family protein